MQMDAQDVAACSTTFIISARISCLNVGKDTVKSMLRIIKAFKMHQGRTYDVSEEPLSRVKIYQNNCESLS